MKPFLFAALLATSFNASAIDVCREGPHALQSFAQARDNGTPYQTIADSLQVESAADPERDLKAFYGDMARWAYQHPQWDADQLIGALFQTCFERTHPYFLTIP